MTTLHALQRVFTKNIFIYDPYDADNDPFVDGEVAQGGEFLFLPEQLYHYNRLWWSTIYN